MGFQKKSWKKRIVEFPGRRKLTATSETNTYDVTRAEGEITQAGDGFTETNMNDLEERIAQGIETKSPWFKSQSEFPTTGDAGRLYVDDTVDPFLLFSWDAEKGYVLTGGSGGGDGAADIPLTLPATGWTGSSAPYTQEAQVPQLRETMTPLVLVSGQATDEQIYAYALITGYESGYAKLTFYAADKPAVDLPLIIKGVPAQEVEWVDNTILVPVQASGFSLNSENERYEQTITVEGMTDGLGGAWDIMRSGPVLTLEESKIAAGITDVDRQTDAIKIVCTEVPAADYTMVLYGTFKDAVEGDILVSGLPGIMGRLETVETTTATLQEDVTELKGKTAFHPIIINIDVPSAPTEIAYLGVSLTVPANSFFSITAIAYFNNSQPSFIGISKNEDRFNEITSSRVGYHMASTTFSGYTEENMTLYFWGQWSAATDNSAQVRGFYVTQP